MSSTDTLFCSMCMQPLQRSLGARQGVFIGSSMAHVHQPCGCALQGLEAGEPAD